MVVIELLNGELCSLRRSSVDFIIRCVSDGLWSVSTRNGAYLQVGPFGISQLARAGLIPPNPDATKPEPDDDAVWRERLAQALQGLPATAAGNGWEWVAIHTRATSTRVPIVLHVGGDVQLKWVDGQESGFSTLLDERGWAVSGPLRDEVKRLITSIAKAVDERRMASLELQARRRAAAIADAERTLLGAE